MINNKPHNENLLGDGCEPLLTPSITRKSLKYFLKVCPALNSNPMNIYYFKCTHMGDFQNSHSKTLQPTVFDGC